MSKEMNKLQERITKQSIICGLFMSLIIGLIFNLQIAAIFFLGVVVGLLGYISRSLVVMKWIEKGTFRILFTTLIRICVVVAIVIPMVHNMKLVVAYLTGFIMNFFIEGYCAKM